MDNSTDLDLRTYNMATSKSQECLEHKKETLSDGVLETYSGNLTYKQDCKSTTTDVVVAVSIHSCTIQPI